VIAAAVHDAEPAVEFGIVTRGRAPPAIRTTAMILGTRTIIYAAANVPPPEPHPIKQILTRAALKKS
jgi:hypothetical protein